MRRFFDILWPLSYTTSAKENAEVQSAEVVDLSKLKGVDWSVEFEIALEESRLLSAVEKERRQGAESKAYAYLAGISAILAFVTPLTVEYSEKFVERSISFQTTSVFLLITSLSYLLGAAWSSSKVLEVSVHHRIDPIDYANIWNDNNIKRALIYEILSVVRLNREMVNRKVGYILIAHRFVIRSVFALWVLLMVVLFFDFAPRVIDCVNAVIDCVNA